MQEQDIIAAKFRQWKVCVLIPTYNNATTVESVIRDVLKFTEHVIIVNDGSTDNTLERITAFDQVTVVSYPKNVGKGWALRKGFEAALQKGYDYAITIDSDGQHFAKDLPQFLEKLETSPGGIIIGARNLDQSSVPGKSSFGNKVSNFWFWVMTGLTMPDTQSGFRLYPVYRMKSINFITNKFEFEIEVLVRSSWDGIPVTSVPVKVYYPPIEERISHFQPFRDSGRITILNTFLVIIAVVYIKPRDFFRFIKKKTFGNFSATCYSIQRSLTMLKLSL